MPTKRKTAKSKKPAGASKVVSAVGVAARVRGSATSDLAQAIQAAMTQAILDATAAGISTSEENSDLLRERMMTARQRVLDEFYESARKG